MAEPDFTNTNGLYNMLPATSTLIYMDKTL